MKKKQEDNNYHYFTFFHADIGWKSHHDQS